MESNGQPLLMEADEVVPLLGANMNRRKLYRAVAEKQIPPEIVVHFGTRIYFKRTLLIKWLSGGDQETVARSGEVASVR